MFMCHWVSKNKNKFFEVDKISLYKFKEFLKLELKKIKVRLLSV